MRLMRLAAFKASTGRSAVIVEIDGRKIELSQANAALMSEAAIKQAIVTTMAQDVPIHIHRNQDGSLAVAYGEEPRFWPEDEKIK